MKRFLAFTVFIVALILAFSGLAPLSPSAAKDEPGPLGNKRVIFEEDLLYWNTPQKADRMLKAIQDAGFNVLIVSVWHGRGTIWPSRLAPIDPWMADTKDPHPDILQYLIQRAAERGIEVHAGFTLGLRETESFREFWPEGTPAQAFDIHNRDFQWWMGSLINEVAGRYDVKGISMDYVRTLGFCRSTVCQERYRQSYQRELLTDIQTFQFIPGGILKQTVVPDLVQFQETGVTTMVETIVRPIRFAHPDLVLSVSALPGQIGLEQGQNSIQWLNDGLIDVVFRMDYSLNPDFVLLEALRKQLAQPNALTLLISNIAQENIDGTRRYSSRSGEWLSSTVEQIWQRWPNAGIGVYMSKWLSKDQITHLRKGPGSFPDHVPPPPPKSMVVH